MLDLNQVTARQGDRNRDLLSACQYLGDSVRSEVLPFQIDIEHADTLTETQAEVLMALQVEAGQTAILVTHNEAEAQAMADRIGVMHGGRITRWIETSVR